MMQDSIIRRIDLFMRKYRHHLVPVLFLLLPLIAYHWKILFMHGIICGGFYQPVRTLAGICLE